MELHDIPMGSGYGARMRGLLGEDYRDRNINNAVYEQPARAAYALADGRYAIVSTTTYSSGTTWDFLTPDKARE